MEGGVGVQGVPDFVDGSGFGFEEVGGGGRGGGGDGGFFEEEADFVA